MKLSESFLFSKALRGSKEASYSDDPSGLSESTTIMMSPSDDDLMSEEIREAVEKIVRRHVTTGVHFDHFPHPIIEHYDGKIAITLDVKAKVLKDKVIEVDRRPQFLDIKFLTPIS